MKKIVVFILIICFVLIPTTTFASSDDLVPILEKLSEEDLNTLKNAIEDILKEKKDNETEKEQKRIEEDTKDQKITIQPENIEVAKEKIAHFNIEVNGDVKSYKWQTSTDEGNTWEDLDKSAFTSADTANLNVRMKEDRDGNWYRCIVVLTNGETLISEAAVLSLSEIEEETTTGHIITTQSSYETKKMSVEEFDELLSSLPVYVLYTNYAVQDANYKALYPDLLQAIIKNNSEDDIKNVEIAFVAWDKNNLPVKIKGKYDFSNGDYIVKTMYDSVNLIPGDTYGEKVGLALHNSCDTIASFKAIVIYYETFDGKEWTNPYLDDWYTSFNGVKYSDDLTIYVTVKKE